MPEPTLRSFKTECLRYQLARADLLEQYAACVQALADKYEIEVGFDFRTGGFMVCDSLDTVWSAPRNPAADEFRELNRAASRAGISISELFDSARRHFKPRIQEP